MGNTTSEFDDICMWIYDYDFISTKIGGRNFIQKYVQCRIKYTLNSYMNYIENIKMNHTIDKEKVDIENEFIRIWYKIEKYDYIFYTGPIDLYYRSFGYPSLEYRSIRFEIECLDMEQFQSNSVVNYPSPTEPFTRIVEYKHFLNQSVPKKTTIVREYTMAEGDPYYHVPTKENQALFQKYKDLAEKETNVFFVGRLANYKYYNMDAAILAALEIADNFFTQKGK